MRRIRLTPLSTIGLLLGTLFFAFSLSPSLVPRPFAFQGTVAGLSFAAGYAIGTGLAWLWHYLELPELRRRPAQILRGIAGALCAVVAIGFMWRAAEWQNRVRELMELEAELATQPLTVAGIAAVAAAVFLAALAIVRLFRATFRFLSERMQRYIPRRVSHLVGITLAIALFWTVIDGVIFTFALHAADRSYQQVDALIEDDHDQPQATERTGSPGSSVEWRDLGRQGRNFISSGPTADDLEDFFGEPVPTPIRIYIGLNAADDPEDRARLALEELHRTEAFDRSVLVLATPTGTGWIDPAAADPIEYLYGGDTAIVTAQYSYLPSPLALMVEGHYGTETARALFEKVYGYWSRLPEAERPELYLHGLSLGALNSDRSFDVYDIIQDPFDGALWSGPPFRSETWQTVTARRDAGSPAWLPVFRDGEVVRFANQHTGFDDLDTEWGPFRIGFLQYASDPITFFEPESAFREPAWMQTPRGPDVADELRWYPVVTMLQLAADMAAGGAPPGYGHTYAVEDYLDAWVALAEPRGWEEAEIERLRNHLAR